MSATYGSLNDDDLEDNKSRSRLEDSSARAAAGGAAPGSAPLYEIQTERHGWPCVACPVQHYNLSRFASPVSAFAKLSYVASFYISAAAALFTMLTCPYTYLVLTKTYQVSVAVSAANGGGGGGSAEFKDFVGFTNWCWSWATLVLLPWVAFFMWHYPFYRALQSARANSAGDIEDAAVRYEVPTAVGARGAVSNDSSISMPNAHSDTTPLTSSSSGGGGGAAAAASSGDSRDGAAAQMQLGRLPSFIAPNFWALLSLLGCAGFICFSAMQFTGAPRNGSNFLSASGVGFFLQCDAAGFNVRLAAVGAFAQGAEDKLIVSNGAWWIVYLFALISTALWGLLFFIASLWMVLVSIHLWRRAPGTSSTTGGGGGGGGGVCLGRTLTLFAWAALSAGMTFIFLWIFVFEKAAFFPPALPYTGRQICVRNSCGRTVVVGVTGGSTGIPCSDGCPDGTECATILAEPTCFFILRNLSGAVLHGGETRCQLLAAPVNSRIKPAHSAVLYQLQQWSGNIYARTFCDGVDALPAGAQVNNSATRCRTGICGENCHAFVGSAGPTTLAEMTLQVANRDYFDVSIINGANIAMRVTPWNAVNSFLRDPSAADNPATVGYWCTSAGAGSTWKFDGTKVTPLVVSNASSSGTSSATTCTDSSACSAGQVCGMEMVLVASQDGKALLPTQQTRMVCGTLAGVWTENEKCAWSGNTATGCNTAVGAGTRAQLLACDGAFSTSCFQNGATTSCCGCSTWGSLGVTATEKCNAVNPDWTTVAEPGLRALKAGAMGAYSYPFDDPTSTFTCHAYSARKLAALNTSMNTSSADYAKNVTAIQSHNDASYTVEFCPGGVEISVVGG